MIGCRRGFGAFVTTGAPKVDGLTQDPPLPGLRLRFLIRRPVPGRHRVPQGAQAPQVVLTDPVLVENSAANAGLGFHADCRYSLISPASLARRSTRAAGTGKAMTSGASSGARSPMPSPWWLRPVL
jgi:hypothetical protein